MFEVSQALGEGEAPLVYGECPAEHDTGDSVGRLGTTVEDGMYGFESLSVMV